MAVAKIAAAHFGAYHALFVMCLATQRTFATTLPAAVPTMALTSVRMSSNPRPVNGDVWGMTCQVALSSLSRCSQDVNLWARTCLDKK
jgi:hypothetical protein